MKLAYLANVRFPSERAHATHIAHMCQAFSQHTERTTLFVNTVNRASKEEINEFFKFSANFTIERISHGVLNHKSKMVFYLSQVYFTVGFLLRLQKNEHDILYSRNEVIVWVLSLFRQVDSLVWESHEAQYNWFARSIFKKGVKCVCLSEGVRDFYIEHGVSKNQLMVAHDCIDESFLGPVMSKEVARQKLGLPLGKKIVMYIGGFDMWKGLDTFCQAAELNKNEDVLFAVIGGKEHEVAHYKQKYPAVWFLGAMPYADLPDNQQAADVLVVPNSAKDPVSKCYTSPLKLFAHMASGVPLVVSDVPSIEVVLGKNGTYFKSDDAVDLWKVLQEVISGKTNSSVHTLKTRVREFTWSARAEKILNFVLR